MTDKKDYSGYTGIEHLFDEVKQEFINFSHHYSDLYLPVTELTTQILRRRGILLTSTVSTFTSDLPEDKGAMFYDVAFAYTAYWVEKSS